MKKSLLIVLLIGSYIVQASDQPWYRRAATGFSERARGVVQGLGVSPEQYWAQREMAEGQMQPTEQVYPAGSYPRARQEMLEKRKRQLEKQKIQRETLSAAQQARGARQAAMPAEKESTVTFYGGPKASTKKQKLIMPGSMAARRQELAAGRETRSVAMQPSETMPKQTWRERIEGYMPSFQAGTESTRGKMPTTLAEAQEAMQIRRKPTQYETRKVAPGEYYQPQAQEFLGRKPVVQPIAAAEMQAQPSLWQRYGAPAAEKVSTGFQTLKQKFAQPFIPTMPKPRYPQPGTPEYEERLENLARAARALDEANQVYARVIAEEARKPKEQIPAMYTRTPRALSTAEEEALAAAYGPGEYMPTSPEVYRRLKAERLGAYEALPESYKAAPPVTIAEVETPQIASVEEQYATQFGISADELRAIMQTPFKVESIQQAPISTISKWQQLQTMGYDLGQSIQATWNTLSGPAKRQWNRLSYWLTQKRPTEENVNALADSIKGFIQSWMPDLSTPGRLYQKVQGRFEEHAKRIGIEREERKAAQAAAKTARGLVEKEEEARKAEVAEWRAEQERRKKEGLWYGELSEES